MTKLVVRSIKKALSNIPSTPDLWPCTDYKRNIPNNARELMEQNWQRTGNNLRNAMSKVSEEIGSKA